jgi:outer membrane protein assembly factor BamB
MVRPQRAGAGLLVLGLLALPLVLPGVRGEQVRLLGHGFPPDDPPAPAGMAVTLPSDTRVRQKLEAARDYIKAREWDEAVRVLQDILDAKEDQFLPVTGPDVEGKPTVYARGLRAETGRLLDALPPKGREAYNAVFGAKARALLKEAVEKDDAQLLAQVVQRYRHTDAGAEAAERLGTYHLDRGNRDFAGRYFADLLGRPDAEDLPPLTLYKAAVACRLSGDKAHEEQAWKALAARAPDGLTIGGHVYELDRLRADLARLSAASPGRGDGDLPLLEPQWKVDTLGGSRKSELIDGVLKALGRPNRVVLPGFYPIAGPGRVVYRSHGGVHALDPAGGRELWKVASPLGLEALADSSGKAVTVTRSWLPQATYNNDAYHFAAENSALGRLSADGERVYAVEDLAVPPPPEITLPPQPGMPSPGGPLRDALFANRLRAIDLETGEVAWEKGGRGTGDLHNSFFLGAPLPVGGRLYALVEKDGDIRLVCLDPASGAVVWAQRLGATAERLLFDPGRRLRGVQMTHAGGLLICPTGAGAVFAFDLFSRGLAWAHLYPSNKPPPQEGVPSFNLAAFNAAWRESAPAAADGKLVFTPGDSDRVHCVRLRDGKPVWEAGQDGYAYLAGVFRDKVLLVGPAGARALSLKDGREAWSRNVGVPSGQGVASGTVYYLPLKSSGETGGPGVAAIDTASGKVLSFARSRGGEVPGNLTFFRGQVISQTATELTVYPQLKARLKRIEELLAGDPRNPRGLAERGALRLDQGDVPGALADLRDALAGSPPGEVRLEAHARLHEALRQVVQRDFAAGQKYLAEFEASCRVPVPAGAAPEQRSLLDTERQRREANFLLVLARGREGQGRVAEALAAYAKLYARADRVLGAWSGEDVGWVPLGKSAAPPHFDRGAAPPRPDVWVHSRVTALLTNARPEQKAAIEKEVARQWQAIPAGADLDEVGRFMALFGSAGAVGLEARLAYAERLAAQHARGRFLEAELHLLALQRQREAPQVAARALEALARLLTEKRQTEDALYYYRQLAEEFGRAPVRDGKTGADFLKGLALDKRFLPLLDDPWAGRKYKTAEVKGLFLRPRGQSIGMEPEGEAPPCLRRQRLAFDAGNGALVLCDRNTDAVLWSHAAGTVNLRQVLRSAPPQAWIPYRADGHLAVVTLGHVAYGIDLLERRLLWTKDLGERPAPLVQQATADDRNRLSALYQDGISQPLGRVAPIQPAGVALTVRGKLAALDPLRGDTLWTVALNDPTADLFADDTHVYLVEATPQKGPALRRAVSLRGGAVQALGGRPVPAGEPLQTVGRDLLASWVPSMPPNRGGRLALYDPLAREEVWTQPLAAGTFVARSEVPHLTATVARDGKVRVYDLRRREELFKAEVDTDHLRGVYEVRLFQDRWHIYLLLNRELRARDALVGPPAPNAVGGLRSLPAQGALYAFRRGTGSLHWSNEVRAQHLLLERFEESPLLLFSAVVQRTQGNPPPTGPVFTVTSIDKRTGKTVWLAKDYAPITSPVHTVQINPATGTIDMISRHWKMRHSIAE